MLIGITFDRHEMKGKTLDFQTWRMVFLFILLVNIWVEEHYAPQNIPPHFFLTINLIEIRIFLKSD